jgi:hypothetical protein
MRMNRKINMAWTVGALAGVGVFAIYVALYAVTVHPASGPTIAGRSVAGRLACGTTVPLEPVCDLGGSKAGRVIFSPLLWVDRRVRASYWTYTETNQLGLKCGYQVELEAKWSAVTNAAIRK